MGRGRVWQGIRDWFRPVDRIAPGSRRGTVASIRSGSRPTGEVAAPRVWNRVRLEAVRDADPAEAPRELGGVSGAGEAVLDPAIDDAELLEFMAADLDPVPADPAFRERLREELWAMVLDQGTNSAKDS